uniref:RNase H type-1 domain-containing protein n=1 Tax=Chenopodium quinoa TaxID=63459 RepID=A0A803MQJ4_CHEQI
MKARYFRRTSLYEAKHGHDPSYIWSSLWSILGLFKEGLGRSIGDGRDTMVWKDRWVFDNEKYISLQKPPGADDGSTVYDLMHEGEQRWNVEKISGVLGHVTPSVLAIPLSQHVAKDGYFWMGTRSGMYTVKAGYWRAREAKGGAGLILTVDDWRLVWRLAAPPKLQHFLWNVIKGNMAVKARLAQRRYLRDVDIWRYSDFGDLLNKAPADSFLMRWRWLRENVNNADLLKIGALLWASWRCRNLHIFEHSQPNVVMLAANYSNWVADHMLYATKLSCQPHRTAGASASRWSCPPHGVIKANVDAHRPHESSAGLGAVFRNAEGSIVLAVTKSVASSTPKCLEAQAVRFALNLARRFGHSKLWVETDALNVVKVLSTHGIANLAPMFRVYNDIVLDRACFDYCIISHAKRCCNTLAHLVARGDTEGNSEVIRFGYFPQSYVSLAMLDLVD